MRSIWRNLLWACACAALLAAAGCEKSEPGPSSEPASAGGQGERIDWPLFGRVEERTHFIARAPRPPYRDGWQFFAHQLLEFAPALADGVLYTVNKTGEVYAVRTTDGKVEWKRNLGNDVTGPTYADGRVLVAQEGGTLVALDAGDGSKRWTFKARSELESSPLAVEGTVYLGSDEGDLWAVDAADGRPRWHADLGAAVKASPSFHDGTVYVGDYGGTIHAVDARDGRIEWSTDTTKLPPGGDGGFYASPSIAFGHVFEARDDGAVFALDLNGRPAWHFAAGPAVYGSPAVGQVDGTGPTVFVGSYDSNLYALDARTGRERWRHDVGGRIPGTPTVLGGVVYTSSFKTKKTLGLDARTGRRVFEWGSAGYEPMITDGQANYLTGFQTVWKLTPKD